VDRGSSDPLTRDFAQTPNAGLLVDVPNGASPVRMHTVIPRLSATPGEIRWSGGALGQHNRDIYHTELGLSCEQMQHLQESGVI